MATAALPAVERGSAASGAQLYVVALWYNHSVPGVQRPHKPATLICFSFKSPEASGGR